MTDKLDLAVIGNSVVGALLDKRARIVWYCLPRFDGDPFFSSLMDKDDTTSGFADVEMADLASTEQAYARNTAILTTVLTDTRGGQIRITDFVPRFKRFERVYRPRMVVRRIEPVQGLCMVRLRVRPNFAWGSTQPTRTVGSNHLRYVGPDFTVRLTTDAPISFIEEEAQFALSAPIHMIFGPDETIEESPSHIFGAFHERTMEYWIDWTRYLSVPFEYQDAIIRSAITLKLCNFEDSGAIVAALTTSIPEAPDSGRNWDYRYCWLRDAYFVVQALNQLGATRTMEDYLNYITTVIELEHGGDIKPVYGILPDQSLEERVITSLPGFKGMGPVRVGNQAYIQHQYDTYGSIILAAAQMFYDRRLPKPGDEALYARLELVGAKAAANAFTPDAGLWEFRGKARVHTHSAAMCWAACSRLSKIGRLLGLDDRAAYWREEADRIRKGILEQGWNAELNSFTAGFGGDDLDASLLLLHEIGFIGANDPRFIGTVDAITQRLRRGDHLIRYDAEDDFGLPEVSFVVCTCWYIDALSAMGRRDEARELYEGILARRNHVGILSEDLNPMTGQLWGNIPQTYSMVGIILSGMRVSRTWEEAFWRGL
ncbi:MAG: glycoside hydrolase family 15 protein [Geminicoccaceae bacterium]